MTKPVVLIIDDDLDYLSLLKEALEDEYTVYCAETLALATEYINAAQPIDIALVDEHIGQDSGSQWIMQQNETDGNIPKSFILYSGLATEEAILHGLECGADDFLTKPISLFTLKSKLEKLFSYHSKIGDFEKQLKSKDNVIHISMTQASKYGGCMQLTSRLNHCFSFEQIRDTVFSFLYDAKLHGCIAFYPIEKPAKFYHSVKGYCSPVEMEVMEMLKHKPRLYTFGNRTIFNHPLASILLLNLIPGSVETDIYIDAFASVIEAIGTRMMFITYKESLVDVQTQIETAVSKTKRMVEVSKHHQQEIMNDIVTNMGTSFHILEMSEEQEVYLMELVHDALKKHSQDDVNFMEVTTLLDDALHSVDRLKQLNKEDVFDLPNEEEEDELF